MKRRNWTLATVMLTLVTISAAAAAEPNAPAALDPNGGAKPRVVSAVTVAIMDFESKAPGNPDLGAELGDILTARLSIQDQFRLVERKKLQDTIKELQVNLSGLAENDQAVKVGKILGARILIFGRAFPVDKDLYIVAKVVGTETSRVKGVIASGKLEGRLSDVIDDLAQKLAAGLEQWGPQLLPENEKLEGAVERLKQQLAGKKLPAVAVTVSEQHGSRRPADPAAATEIKRVLKEIGFTVIDPDGRSVSERWSANANLAEAQIVVSGAGVSDFVAQLGGLVSCVARLEIQAAWRDSGKVIAAERTTRRAVDLSETIAAKTALQAAGHELAIQVAENIARAMVTDGNK
jgi:hypothetical protein